MQRGRYIRTVADGYLIEVLRVSAAQVAQRNIPSDVRTYLVESPTQDISLVNVFDYCCS